MVLYRILTVLMVFILSICKNDLFEKSDQIYSPGQCPEFVEKTANLSRVLMCVFATKTCYLTLLFLYFFYTKIYEIN